MQGLWSTQLGASCYTLEVEDLRDELELCCSAGSVTNGSCKALIRDPLELLAAVAPLFAQCVDQPHDRNTQGKTACHLAYAGLVEIASEVTLSLHFAH